MGVGGGPALLLVASFVAWVMLFVIPIWIKSWNGFLAYSTCANVVIIVLLFKPEYDLFFITFFSSAHILAVFVGFIRHYLRADGNNKPLRIKIFVTCVAIFGGGPLLYYQWKTYWFMGFLPESLDVYESIYVGRGFREDCEVAVFRLRPQSLKRFRSHNIAALSGTELARSKSFPNFAYGSWHETPYVLTGNGLSQTDHWLNGLGCSRLDREQLSKIHDALESGNSFFSKSSNAGLIVIPSLDLVVFSSGG